MKYLQFAHRSSHSIGTILLTNLGILQSFVSVFISFQVKRNFIFSITNSIYELPHELRNDLDIRC